MLKNDEGFGHVGVLVVVIVLALVGLSGWFVWSKNNKPDASSSSKQSETKENNSQEKSDASQQEDKEAQSWTQATSTQGGFTLRIPDGWTVYNYGESNNIRSNQITYSSGTKAAVNNLETAYAGDSLVRFQVIQLNDGDNFKFLDGDEQKTPFSAGELNGSRYYKTYPLEELQGVGAIPGEETYTYEFKTPGKTTYIIYRILNKNQYSEEFLKNNYQQTASDPNQLELIDRVVKTLVIH